MATEQPPPVVPAGQPEGPATAVTTPSASTGIAGVIPIAGPLVAVSVLIASCAAAHELLFFPAGAGPALDVQSLPWASAGGQAAERTSAALRDNPARLLWGLALLLQTVVFAGAIAVFGRAIWQSLRRATSAAFAAVLAGAVVVAAAAIWLGAFRHGMWSAAGPSGYNVVSRLLAAALDAQGLTRLGVVVDVENGLVAAVIFLGAVAIGAVLLPDRTGPSEYHTLSRQIDQLRWLLTAAAAVLITGVVQIGLEYHWVASLFRNVEEPAKGWEPGTAMASAVTLAAGVLFSLILAAAVIPAAVALRRRVADHNRTAVPSGTIEFDLGDLYWGVAKVAGPVLAAGPLAYLFKA